MQTTMDAVICTDLCSSFMQVFTSDGRLISGIFTCLDKQGNIVLQHAAQHLEPSDEERHLGTVIVPRNQRIKTQAMVLCQAVHAHMPSSASVLIALNACLGGDSSILLLYLRLSGPELLTYWYTCRS